MSFQLTSNAGAIMSLLEKRGSDLVRDTAARLEAEIKISYTGRKSGRIYKRGSRTHQASAPGEAPAVDAGNLSNSTQWVQESRLRAVIGTSAEYAEVLEFGGVKMLPRPFMGPAFEKVKPIFEAGLRALMRG